MEEFCLNYQYIQQVEANLQNSQNLCAFWQIFASFAAAKRL